MDGPGPHRAKKGFDNPCVGVTLGCCFVEYKANCYVYFASYKYLYDIYNISRRQPKLL